ncbi:MAG: type II toxin-antitoxin system RatA family toxin, partial [Hyphomicrobium sp.]
MHTYQTTRRVPFRAEQMFAVVADVERYPEFLPLCESIDVRSREKRGAETELVAAMAIGYHAIAESFTSRVTLQPGKGEILVAYLDGPFSHLENRWGFRDVSGGSEVDFFISYEFRSS